MSMALPEDVDGDVVDLAQFAAMLAATSKPIVVSSPFGGDSLAVMREMAAICGEAGSFACLAMASPPLSLDEVAADKTIACARLGIPLVMSTAPSAGSTGPASIPALVLISNAEILATLVLHQLASGGAPFVYGAGVGVMNMRTGTDPYMPPGSWLGAPGGLRPGRLLRPAELVVRVLLRQQGARRAVGARGRHRRDPGSRFARDAAARRRLPRDRVAVAPSRRSSSATRWPATRAPFSRSYRSTRRRCCLAEIAAVGPGGAHLSRPYTRAHHRDFWQTELLDQCAHERWRASGGQTLRERLRDRTRELCSSPPAFSLERPIRERLERLVKEAARRDPAR